MHSGRMVAMSHAVLVTEVNDAPTLRQATQCQAQVQQVLQLTEKLLRRHAELATRAQADSVGVATEAIVTLLERKHKALQRLRKSNAALNGVLKPSGKPTAAEVAQAFKKVNASATKTPITISNGQFCCSNPFHIDFGANLVSKQVISRILELDNNTSSTLLVNVSEVGAGSGDPHGALSFSPVPAITIACSGRGQFTAALQCSVRPGVAKREFDLVAGAARLRVVVKAQVQQPSVQFFVDPNNTIDLGAWAPSSNATREAQLHVRNTCGVPLTLKTRVKKLRDSNRQWPTVSAAFKVPTLHLGTHEDGHFTLVLRPDNPVKYGMAKFDIAVGVSSAALVEHFTAQVMLLQPTWQVTHRAHVVSHDDTIDFGNVERGAAQLVMLSVTNTSQVPLLGLVPTASQHFSVGNVPVEGVDVAVGETVVLVISLEAAAPRGNVAGFLRIAASGVTKRYRLAAKVGAPLVQVVGSAVFDLDTAQRAVASTRATHQALDGGSLVTQARVTLRNEGDIPATVQLPLTGELFASHPASGTVEVPAENGQREVALSLQVSDLEDRTWDTVLHTTSAAQPEVSLSCQLRVKNAKVTLNPAAMLDFRQMAPQDGYVEQIVRVANHGSNSARVAIRVTSATIPSLQGKALLVARCGIQQLNFGPDTGNGAGFKVIGPQQEEELAFRLELLPSCPQGRLRVPIEIHVIDECVRVPVSGYAVATVRSVSVRAVYDAVLPAMCLVFRVFPATQQGSSSSGFAFIHSHWLRTLPTRLPHPCQTKMTRRFQPPVWQAQWPWHAWLESNSISAC